MPNLRGASPVGRDVRGRSYATHTISRGNKPKWRRRGMVESSMREGSRGGRGGARDEGWSMGRMRRSRDKRDDSRADGVSAGRPGEEGKPGWRGTNRFGAR